MSLFRIWKSGIFVGICCWFHLFLSNRLRMKAFSKICFRNWAELCDFPKNVKKLLNFENAHCGQTTWPTKRYLWKDKVHIFYLVPWDFNLVCLLGHSDLMKIMDHLGRWQNMSDSSISSSLSLSCPCFYTLFYDSRTRGAILLFTWPATKATLRLPSNLLTACPILTPSTWLGWPLCKLHVKGDGLRSCLSC